MGRGPPANFTSARNGPIARFNVFLSNVDYHVERSARGVSRPPAHFTSIRDTLPRCTTRIRNPSENAKWHRRKMCRLCIGNYSGDPSLDEQLTDLHEILEAVIRAALADEALASIIREGHRTGEGRGEFPGEVHYKALRAAETDATKRALATFRKPFWPRALPDWQANNATEALP